MAASSSANDPAEGIIRRHVDDTTTTIINSINSHRYKNENLRALL